MSSINAVLVLALVLVSISNVFAGQSSEKTLEAEAATEAASTNSWTTLIPPEYYTEGAGKTEEFNASSATTSTVRSARLENNTEEAKQQVEEKIKNVSNLLLPLKGEGLDSLDLNLNSIQLPIESSSSPGGKVTEADLTDELANYVAPYYLRRNFPYYLAGYDENNSPIIVAELGRMDIRGLVEKGQEAQDELVKYCKQAALNCIRLVKAASTPENPVTGFTFLVDFEGFQLKTLASLPTLTYLLKLARQFSDITDKWSEAGYAINADFVTHQLINVVKPVMGRVIAKMEVFGTTKSGWMPTLRRVLGERNLAPWYGGKKDYKPVVVYGR